MASFTSLAVMKITRFILSSALCCMPEQSLSPSYFLMLPVSHLRMLSNTAIGCSAQTIRSGLVRIALVWESRRFARERFCPVYFRVFPDACFSIHLRLIFPIELCLFSCLVESDFHWAHSLLAGERRGRLIERLIFIIYREWWFYLAMFVSELHHVLLNKLWNLELNFYKR